MTTDRAKVSGDMSTVTTVLRCHGCDDPVCEECRGHKLPNTGPYEIVKDRILCPHCAADTREDPARCPDCKGTRITILAGKHRGKFSCACSATGRAPCNADPYDTNEEVREP